MTSPKPSRFRRCAPSLLLAGLLFLGACASTPQRPQAPIFTGGERAPVQPPAPEETLPPAPVETVDIPGLEAIEPLDDGYTPPHMIGRDVQRLAVLLPFSHPNANVRREAEGMLAGIELALFNSGNENMLILPKDTGGTVTGATQQAEAAMTDKADLIIGPLFAANVKAVREVAAPAGIPVIAFSNDPTAGGGGAYLASIAPEEEVRRVVDYAARAGIRTFAFLGPSNDYGRRIEATLRGEAAQRAGFVISSAFYSPTTDAPVDEAKLVADAVAAELDASEDNVVAVLIPERGVKLRAVAPLLPYYGVDTRRIQLLGTGAWNDPSLWREPTLQDALFAAPPAGDMAAFNAAYERNYGRPPTNLASLGYDAVALGIQLAEAGQLTTDGVTSVDGFVGVNGLFRFREDGTAERGLAVYEITRQGTTEVIEDGPETFEPAAG